MTELDAPTAAERGNRAAAWLASARGLITRHVAIDTRALAAFRISIAALILLDLAMRAVHLSAFYTDAGVLPRSALRAMGPFSYRVSLHALSGDAGFQALLFVVAALFAVALLVGYRTRLMTAASFVMLESLLARNPLVLNAGDALLLLLVFWGFFLPLGARWSVDARLRGGRLEPVAGIASAALLIQVILVYSANAAFKARTDHWLQGDALQYVFSNTAFTVPPGAALASHPALLTWLGWAWFSLIAASPLLLVARGRIRLLLAVLLAGGHVSMLLTMRLGIFPLVSLAGLLPFLPPAVWDQAEKRLWAPVVRIAERLGTTRMARRDARPPGKTLRAWRTVEPGVVGILLACAVASTAAGLGWMNVPDAYPLLHEERSWTMFANPGTSEVWYVVTTDVQEGTMDVLSDAPVQWDRPSDISSYPDMRWRKYLSNLQDEGADLPAHLASYGCRQWQDAHSPLGNVTVVRVDRDIDLDGPDPESRRTVLLEHACPA